MASPRPTFRDLGPGLLLAATGIGAGDMVGATIAGAEYGLTLVWALAAGVLVKLAITEGVARWQLATGTTILEGWRDHLPVVAVVVFFLYFMAWSYFVSSALVAASALVPAALTPVGVPIWGIAHAGAALAMVWVGRYEGLLNVMKVFIGMMFAAVLATVLLIIFRTGADWTTIGSQAPLSVPYTLSLIGGVGGTVTLLSYGYWMREAGWSGPGRMAFARADLLVSFGMVFLFALAMIFLATQISWSGAILDEGPELALLLGDRIGAEIGAVGRGIFLAGFWGAAFSSVVGVWHGVPFLFDDAWHLWQGQSATGQRGSAYRTWAVIMTGAAISAMFIRPVWLVFAYTVVSSLFFPFVIATLLWMNNSRFVEARWRSTALVNGVLVASLLLYVYLAVRSLPL